MTEKCPCCGAINLMEADQNDTLLAVCDVLVVKALEKIGNYIMRAERGRYNARGSRPLHELHAVWTPEEDMVTKALKGAWDIVPVLMDSYGCCGVTTVQVKRTLDDYVHDLAITGTKHSVMELMFRFENRLGITVFREEVLSA